MEDNRIDVLERLAAADPVHPAAEFDQARADRVLAAILSEPHPVRRRTRKKLIAVAAAVVAVAGIAAPTLAFSGHVRSLLGFQSPAVLEESKLRVAAPVAEGTVARLWTSPSKRGGECVFVTFGPPGPVEHAAEMGGGACGDGPFPGARIPLTLSVSVGKRPSAPKGATAWVPPLVDGWINPVLGATRVEIRWNGGSKALAFADGYFIGVAEELYDAPAAVLPIFLVAYNADGQEVSRRKIDAEWFRLD
jgi:hypothetical protein